MIDRVMSFVLACLFCTPIQSFGKTYECTAASAFGCDAEKCEPEDLKSRNPETFGYDSKTKILATCLGESCMEGKMIEKRSDQDERVVFGIVRETDQSLPGRRFTMPIVLTISKTNDFSVLRPLAALGTFIEYGRCK